MTHPPTELDKIDSVEFDCASKILSNHAHNDTSQNLTKKQIKRFEQSKLKEQKLKQKQIEIEAAFTEAKDKINVLCEEIELGQKNTLIKVIEIGEILNPLATKYKKAKFGEWLQKINFKLNPKTASNYRNVAAFKDQVLAARDKCEAEAANIGVAPEFLLTHAYKIAADAKRAMKLANGSKPRKERLPKQLSQPNKSDKLPPGISLLKLRGPTAEVSEIWNLLKDELNDITCLLEHGESQLPAEEAA